MNIESAISTTRSQIQRLELQYQRQPGSVELLAVSKKKPISDIRIAIAAGQRAFGENYVSEAIEKIREIDDPSITWHFIGSIQSRKTTHIAEHFHWAHGVDRIKIATRLSEQRPADLPPLEICLQVNLDNESSKSGVAPNELAELADQCAMLKGVRLRGLMAIPAPRENLREQREVFEKLHACLRELQQAHTSMDTLSMGMSADLEAAIAEGATIVRIGTAIFGARD